MSHSSDRFAVGAPRPGSRAGHVARTFAHALGNVLIGLAIGLAMYYGLTDLMASSEQYGLRDDLQRAGDDFRGVRETAGAVLDFAGLEEFDVAYWKTQDEGEALGRIVIERIDVDVVVVKGHSRSSLKRGPGWIDYTDLPGVTGNFGIAGHRTTYGAPFRRIDELERGDIMDFYSPFRRYRYLVVDISRVTPDRVDVMDSTAEPRLTLSACDPPYSARYRIIVSADLIAASLLDEGS